MRHDGWAQLDNDEEHGGLLIPMMMLHWVYLLDGSDVPIEHVLVVVVFRLDEFVSYLESPSEPLHRGLTGLRWVQRPLK